MSAKILLIELAREDARLYQLRQQIASLPRRMQDLDAQRRDVERALQECDAVYQKAEKERRRLELELQEYRQKRAKSEARQSALTSTEAYQAVQREIQLQEQRIDELESAVLEAMERGTQAVDRRDAEIVRLKAEGSRLDALRAQLDADLARAKAEVTGQKERRDARVQELEPATRSLYERVLRAKGDAAIALVGERECGICHALQPPQVLQELRGDAGRLHSCQICGRILVWDPEAQQS